MVRVYVLNSDGRPLMPCVPAIARLLLKAGKAKVVRRTPFTIKLFAPPTHEHTQPLTLGIDTGSTMVGAAVADEQGKVVYLSEVELRKDITATMKERAAKRRNRRQRNTRYRPARCAPCHAAMYLPKIGKELEGRFLDHPSYLELKNKGDHSMTGTRGTSRDVADEWYPQDPRRMAKARLLEL